MLDKFMSEHLYGKNIEVYFGGSEEERMQGKLVGSADGVIVLEYKNRRDYINVEKIVAVWET
ncbi:MAG: hypothetical protein PHY05_06660 [Methanothrix sp.]|jgi:hypothetical protein|nr:hypothetical protein [Methanothrix sp.]